MPRHVRIYEVDCSPFYWTRCFVNGRYHIKSTETTNKKLAYEFAKEHFMGVLRSDEPRHILKPKTFSSIAMSLLEQERATSKKSLYVNDKGKINSTILPFFKDKLIDQITHRDLSDFLTHLNKLKIKEKKAPYRDTDKLISPATKKHHIGLVHKIFKHAVEIGSLQAIPHFPKLKEKLRTTQKRDYFTWGEYNQLQRCVNKMIDDQVEYKGTPITLEHKLLINFMINSFIRPSDLKVLKRKHVVNRSDPKSKTEWLTLTHPATKTTAQEVQTMPDAVKYYRELTTFRKAEYRSREKAHKKLVAGLKKLDKSSASPAPPQDYLSPDDYVFMPQYENRSTALEKLGKIFALIIETSGLEKKRAKNLTLYSLRHTAIMYRLMNSDIDSLALAKNARTSQAVIERFYGSHLTTEHVRKKLHSFKQVA
jgi:integrase